jgi:hypothetical protein
MTTHDGCDDPEQRTSGAGLEPFAFLGRLRATVPGSRTAVLVWTKEELTGPRRAQLEAALQAVVVKGQGGTQALPEELQAWLSGAGGRAGHCTQGDHSSASRGAPTGGQEAVP